MRISADSFDIVLWVICTRHTMRLPANDNSALAAMAGAGIYPLEN